MSDQPNNGGQQPPVNPENASGPVPDPAFPAQQWPEQVPGTQQPAADGQYPPYQQAPGADQQPTQQYYSQPDGFAQQPQDGYAQQPQDGYAQQPQDGYAQQPQEGFAQQQGGYPQQGGFAQTGAPEAYPGYQQDPSAGYPGAANVPPGQPPFGGPGQVPGAPDQPKKSKKGLFLGLGIAGAAIVLLGGGAGIFFAVQSASHSPEHTVEAFLDDVKDGHVADALKQAGIKTTDDDILLTDKAYAGASDRVSGYTVKSTKTEGDTAQVTVSLKQGKNESSQTFQLKSTGKDMIFFDTWQLNKLPIETIDIAELEVPEGGDATIAGVPLADAIENAEDLRALPGTYPVEIAENEWFTGDPANVTVSGFKADTVNSPSTELSFELTDAGTKAVNAAIDEYLDNCVSKGELLPLLCPFGAKKENESYVYTNIVWTLNPRPVTEITPAGGRWSISTTTKGSASATADVSDPATGRSGTSSVSDVKVSIMGSVRGFEDGKADISVLPSLF